ncbi:hypothetical protein BD626DRAFT_473050 [Schizophyllum amplum]|uniref:Uncharacterized protein n=1 Tax=Schizophyllum amplum TaxID=97359 RepID=A0A550CWG9_9AGAR|nr:hypothetical protein BD626DRAFT_473050 [Auriculariopsis ampla]
MAKDEDSVPSEYKYVWQPESGTSLDDFVQKYRPSMVQNDGTKPWIWVTGDKVHATADGWLTAIEEAADILKETTEKVEAIKNDASIPVRSNKKTGARSKKEVREEVQAEATEKLKAISQKHGYVTGKWLIFAPADKVDMIWSGIAKSIVSGPLASTAAFRAKVSTSPENDQPHYQHVICVYVPDVYDKDAMAEVMRVLLRNHGAALSGVKSDLYTYIGIDSKHPSGIPSTIWKNNAVISDVEAKELKDIFFKDLAETKPDTTASTDAAADRPATTLAAAPKKPQLKKKKKVNDPFASDSDEADNEPENDKTAVKPPSANSTKPLSKASIKPPSKASAKPPSRASAKPPSKKTTKRKADPFESASEDEDRSGSDSDKKPVKKATKPLKKRSKIEEEDEEEGPKRQPRKRTSVRK